MLRTTKCENRRKWKGQQSLEIEPKTPGLCSQLVLYHWTMTTRQSKFQHEARVLSAEWLLRTHLCNTYRIVRAGGCLVVVAQWQNTDCTSQVSWIRFPVTVGLFTFCYFCINFLKSAWSYSLPHKLNILVDSWECQRMRLEYRIPFLYFAIWRCTLWKDSCSTAWPLYFNLLPTPMVHMWTL